MSEITLGDIVKTPDGEGVVMIVMNPLAQDYITTGYYVELAGGAGGGYNYMRVPHLDNHPYWEDGFVPDDNFYVLNFYTHSQIEKKKKT